MFEKAAIINETASLNTVCNAVAAIAMATALSGLTEVILFEVGGEVGATSYYVDGEHVAYVKAGENWGEELTAIIEKN